MNDEQGARPIAAHGTLLGPEEAERRLRRLERVRHAGLARRGRIKLILDTLDGIASGSVRDPAGTASVVVAGIDEKLLFGRRGAPDTAGGRRGNDEPAAAGHAPRSDQIGDSNVDSRTKRLIRKAETISHRVEIQDSVLDFLYEKSRWRHLPRTDWENAVRTACAIEFVPKVYKELDIGNVDELVHSSAAAAAFAGLKSNHDPSKGTLVLTFHGAFVVIARRLFATLDNSIIFGRGAAISTTTDPRGALFSALRALEEGRVVMMAPDGPDGKQSVTLNVLGKTRTAGEGAAFLAYASGCNTAWYTVVREGDRFIPVIEQGPHRIEGETLNEFSDRLMNFYCRKIEDFLTGDPNNMLLRPQWQKMFEDNASPARRPRNSLRTGKGL